jgi:hypothetical protein
MSPRVLSHPFAEEHRLKERPLKPYVHISIDAVDTAVHDPDSRYDADRYDRYATFGEARDAALTCVETLLDEGDFDGEDHKAELETMLRLLESAESFEDLEHQVEYRWFLGKLAPAQPVAA